MSWSGCSTGLSWLFGAVCKGILLAQRPSGMAESTLACKGNLFQLSLGRPFGKDVTKNKNTYFTLKMFG